jgi:hypothetical protein
MGFISNSNRQAERTRTSTHFVRCRFPWEGGAKQRACSNEDAQEGRPTAPRDSLNRPAVRIEHFESAFRIDDAYGAVGQIFRGRPTCQSPCAAPPLPARTSIRKPDFPAATPEVPPREIRVRPPVLIADVPFFPHEVVRWAKCAVHLAVGSDFEHQQSGFEHQVRSQF